MALNDIRYPLLISIGRLLLIATIFSGCAGITKMNDSSAPAVSGSESIDWQTSYEEASRLAIARNKPMMLIFYGISSKRLDERVFSDREVIRLAQNFVCIRLGADQNEIIQKYRVQEYPTIIFTDSRGGEYDRAIGYKSQSSFVSILKSALIGVEVEYSIKIEQSRSADVKCVLKNVRGRSVLFYLIEKHDKISSISCESTDGKPGWKEVENSFWEMQLNTFSMKTITLRYKIELNILSRMDYQPSYISYIGEDYGIIDCHALLMIPQGIYATGKVVVNIDIPTGWGVLTPWNEITRSSYNAQRIEEVTDSVFCIGKFQYIKRQVGDKEVYVVYCGTDKYSSDLESKGEVAVQIFKDYISRFGDFPFKKYIAIFAAKTPDGKYIHGTAHGLGFAGPIEMGNTYTLQFMAHEIFHVWNGGVINQRSHYEAWFKEGFTQYYGYITPYRAGLYSENVFSQYLKNDYNDYLRKYELGEDMALYRVNEATARKEGYSQSESIRVWIMYSKGALIASLMDDEIQNKTGGKKTLDDLMNYMFHQYRDKQYSSDDILKAVNAVTEKDFTKFFTDYIYGRAKLPTQKRMKDEG